ncbi:MAG TPA: DNA repair protein RadC [Saprospiraceae bacterium]|nr:DNA repair protein RadC [Saprospiraceae bacterium]
MENLTNFGIKAWAEEDRPREKMLLKGRSAVSDAELIAILLGSGSRNETVVALSQRLLNSVNNNLYDLGRLSIGDLTKFKGIGDAKAITLAAALELGRRRQDSSETKKLRIVSSNDSYQIIKSKLVDLPVEQFWIIYLNRANNVIHSGRISIGGTVGTIADPRIIFKEALDRKASSIVLCHNHPSGQIKPSQSDINLTRRMKQAGEVLDIHVVDHIIVTDNGYFSFSDEGMM